MKTPIRTVLAVILLAVFAQPLAAATPLRVLVLPFNPLNDTGQNAWIGVAVQQDLQADLGRNGTIQTVGFVGNFPAPDPAAALRAAQNASAGLAIFGTYQVVDNQVRIAGQILDAGTGNIAGTLKVTGPVRNLLHVEDALADQARQVISGAAAPNLISPNIPTLVNPSLAPQPESSIPLSAPTYSPAYPYDTTDLSGLYGTYDDGLYSYLSPFYYTGYPFYPFFFSAPLYFDFGHFRHHHHDAADVHTGSQAWTHTHTGVTAPVSSAVTGNTSAGAVAPATPAATGGSSYTYGPHFTFSPTTPAPAVSHVQVFTSPSPGATPAPSAGFHTYGSFSASTSAYSAPAPAYTPYYGSGVMVRSGPTIYAPAPSYSALRYSAPSYSAPAYSAPRGYSAPAFHESYSAPSMQSAPIGGGRGGGGGRR